jgi:hypothetical protein
MYYKVENKLRSHHKNDLERLGCTGNFKIADAIEMVQATGGVCVECRHLLLLDKWAPNDPDQFSFDRLDDRLPHSKDNCRVICLGCNLKKANDQYRPTESFRDYAIVKKQFFKLKAYLVRLQQNKDPFAAAISRECQLLESTLHVMHDDAFGVDKKNNWKRLCTPIPSDKAVARSFEITSKYFIQTSVARRSGSSSESL